VVTTDEEREGFYIIKSIVRELVDPNRVFARDTQSHFGVLLDDNNRKPICRLRFNGSQKYLGLIGDGKTEERVAITSLDDIYQHADRIKQAVGYYGPASKADGG
jgi:predicted type IV restriction endonuclease